MSPTAPPVSLVEFLRARLDEDRELPRQLIAAEVPTRWREIRGQVYGEMTLTMRRIAEIDDVNLGPSGTQLAAEHIARFDPRRMLDDVDAKRAIIEDLSSYCWLWPGHPCGRCERIGCRNLRRMASAYADQPGYREEWRP